MKRLLVVMISLTVLAFLWAGGTTALASEGLSGKVLETMDSGGYTYALISHDGQKTWVAVPQVKIVKGQKVSFKPGMEMSKFESKSLKRTFDKIVFADGLAENGASKGQAAATGSKGKAVAPAEKIKVQKAAGPNAYTVAEIFKNSDKLNKKKVTVKAKVVKVSAGIMKSNWLHLQDGSGDSKKGTHDLVATTKELPAVGDIVTVSGTVSKDKDFGSGYQYKVIIENATLKK